MNTSSLTALVREHLLVAESASSGRSSHTVYGGHVLRQTLIAVAAGQSLEEHANPGEATVRVLHGHVQVTSGGNSWEGSPGDLLTVPDALHSLEATSASAVLLTVGSRRL